MSGFALEDFGDVYPFDKPVKPVVEEPRPDRYEEGYNAGYDDAMAQVETEQGRVAEKFAERLHGLDLDRRAAMGTALTALEPALREIFDRLLPHAAERSFLPILMQEIRKAFDGEAATVTVLVAPEDNARLVRLLDRADIESERVTVRSEPALSINQALLRWDGQERRVDLEGALTALDDALETYLSTMDRGTSAGDDDLMKEAANG
ncbi:hypothetical protein [uncultured Jannaschia sp.]|uniref:hypothetical protein n=1 Tax=uncultured Jannaschia sp. TaxID=293347 RepID=UPI00263827D5|nr:hypothetical protein [uncultured Jannaschia sp.]